MRSIIPIERGLSNVTSSLLHRLWCHISQFSHMHREKKGRMEIIAENLSAQIVANIQPQKLSLMSHLKNWIGAASFVRFVLTNWGKQKNGVARNAPVWQTTTSAKHQRTRSRWHFWTEHKSCVRTEFVRAHIQCASRPCCRCSIHLRLLKIVWYVHCCLIFYFLNCSVVWNWTAPSESPLLLCHTHYWRIEGEARHKPKIYIYVYISIHYKMGLWMIPRDRK